MDGVLFFLALALFRVAPHSRHEGFVIGLLQSLGVGCPCSFLANLPWNLSPKGIEIAKRFTYWFTICRFNYCYLIGVGIHAISIWH
jgi:hypothetical protein